MINRAVLPRFRDVCALTKHHHGLHDDGCMSERPDGVVLVGESVGLKC